MVKKKDVEESRDAVFGDTVLLGGKQPAGRDGGEKKAGGHKNTAMFGSPGESC